MGGLFGCARERAARSRPSPIEVQASRLCGPEQSCRAVTRQHGGRAVYAASGRYMNIWCLLSWYDERADWLTEMVESVAPFVDGVIAVDGPYLFTQHDRDRSPHEQHQALRKACRDHGLSLHMHYPGALTEVDKRAYMFSMASMIAKPMVDWFLIMDGDMWLGAPSWPERARYYLEQTDRHAAEITFHNLDPEIDGQPKVRSFRSMFRAIPGLTVEGTHSTYTVPDLDGERLMMWQAVGERQPVAALDITRHVHLYHRPHLRDPQRQAIRAGYYDRRATANIEQVPEY